MVARPRRLRAGRGSSARECSPATGAAPKPIDVFDREGRYLGTLPAGSPFPIGFLPDGRILVADEFDVERLVLRTATFAKQ